MGKNNRHKKFLKQEKSKVKLKAGKKLTKGQNITDTSFKVKRIVLQNQGSTAADNEPLTRKRLSLKELLSRSKHYNVNMKTEALVGLQELAALHPETLNTNLSKYLETSAARCTNEESRPVRQESLKLLQNVLTQVTSTQLEPFIPMLIIYLSTGMTHLHQDIQEDSLRMLDIILAVAPSLVARAAPVLLPAFLDQISVKRNTGNSERTLSLDLQSNNTSTRWRIKVLGRLHAMLSAVVENTSVQELATKVPEINWSPTGSLYAPVYMLHSEKPCIIHGMFSTGANVLSDQNLFQDENEMKKYISILMPLLFETWSEVGPLQRQQRPEGSLIPTDAADLLECIMETIQHLWQYLQNFERGCGNIELSKWFKKSFRKDFVRHMLAYFPYSTSASYSAKKEKRSRGQAPFSEEPETMCNAPNLAICHMFCNLCDKPEEKHAIAVYTYILNCLSSGQRVSESVVRVLDCILSKRINQFASASLNLDDLVRSAVSCSLRSPSNTSPLFNLLCDLSLAASKKAKLSQSQSIPSAYSKFVEELPSLLLNKEVSAKCLDTIIRLAAVQDTLLLQSVKLYIPRIIANIGSLTVPDWDQRAVQTAIVGILYQASVWRTDILDAVAQCLQMSGVNPELCNNFKQLMQIKMDTDPYSRVTEKLKSMPWYNNNIL